MGVAKLLHTTSGEKGENLTYKHFLNYTYLARLIPSTEPTEGELFGDFLARAGQREGPRHCRR